MQSLKQVIVFRKDIQMNKGKMIAQGAHAAMLVFTKWDELTEGQVTDVTNWALSSMAKIVGSVETLETLEKIVEAAKAAGLLVYKVTDSAKAGLEIKGIPTVTCIAIGPATAEDVDKITGREGSHPIKLL